MLIKECVVIQTDDYNIPLKSVAKPAAPAVEEEEPEEEKPITYRAPEIRGNDVLNVFLAYVLGISGKSRQRLLMHTW